MDRPFPSLTSIVASKRSRRIVLAVILLFGFALRAWNINWDEGTHQHPDERFWSIIADDVEAPDSVGQYFDSETSPLNPYQNNPSFVYGTAPLFTTMVVAEFMTDGPQPAGAVASALDAVGVDLLRDDGTAGFDADYNINIIGRLLSALIDTATILLVYLLARELFGRRTGLVAAFLMSVTVLHVQYAHFFGAEPWAAFFVTAVMLGSVKIAKGDVRWRTVLLSGAALGFAVASKLNTAVAAFLPFIAVLVTAVPLLRPFGREKDRLPILGGTALVGAGSAAYLLSTAGLMFTLVFLVAVALLMVLIQVLTQSAAEVGASWHCSHWARRPDLPSLPALRIRWRRRTRRTLHQRHRLHHQREHRRGRLPLDLPVGRNHAGDLPARIGLLGWGLGSTLDRCGRGCWHGHP